MYAQLLKGLPDTTRPREDSQDAEEELMSCLKATRRLWTGVRSVVFANTEPDVIAAGGSASLSIGGFANVGLVDVYVADGLGRYAGSDDEGTAESRRVTCSQGCRIALFRVEP